MRWNRWYRLKSYFRSALWIVPFIALVLENIAIRLVFRVHERIEWLPWFGATAAATSEVLNTVETLSISFIVFSFGSLLVAIQVASGQLDAADYRDDAAAKQRHPLHRRPVYLHHAVRRRHRRAAR